MNSSSEELNQDLNVNFNHIVEKFKSTFEKYKITKANSYENIELHVEFMKEQLQIRIESLKNQLDELYKSLNNELDGVKEKWKTDMMGLYNNTINESAIEIELSQFQSDIINHQQNLTCERIQNCENKLKELEKSIKIIDEDLPRLNFSCSNLNIGSELIGRFIYHSGQEIHRKILDSVKNDKHESICLGDIDTPPELCVIPNGMLLGSNFSKASLLLFDSDMQLLQTINIIDGKVIKIIGMAINDENHIYLSDTFNHVILKTDLNFNKLAQFGNGCGSDSNQFNWPTEICYYNRSLFVCDFYNNRIQKLSSDLQFQASYPLTFSPWSIKNIRSIACLRAFNGHSIYFYNLDSFTQVGQYDGHNGIVGVSNECFYEYYHLNKVFYCYNKNGILIEQIQTNGLGLKFGHEWNSMCLYNANLLITDYFTNNITRI